MSTLRSTGRLLVPYLGIAAVVTVLSVLALVAPGHLLGLAVLVAPFVLVGIATDADRNDVSGVYGNAFGPESRTLPTI